jgi:2-polyprenyl-6-methoxyphenol hydroxylase-like FAD-dependent oxidoreductase
VALRRLACRGRKADDFYFDAFTQVHMQTISQGRVTLVGDAGYCASPLSGMGTSLALVGAYVLRVSLGLLMPLTHSGPKRRWPHTRR